MTRMRCIVAGGILGILFCSFTYFTVARFIIGPIGGPAAVLPPEIRRSLVITFLEWVIILGAFLGMSGGAFMPTNMQAGSLSFFSGTMSGIGGLVCAWVAEFEYIHRMHALQIGREVLISVAMLILVLLIAMTGGRSLERIIRRVN